MLPRAESEVPTSDIQRAVGRNHQVRDPSGVHVVEPNMDGETAMPFDLRRCAQAAAHAALAEAFAPPQPQPRRRRRPRLRPVRKLLLGAGLVTTARVALDPVKRRELFEALARRFPIQELLDEIVLEADVVPDADDSDEPQLTGQESAEERQPEESGAKPAQRSAPAKKPAAAGKNPAAAAKKPAPTATKPTAKKPAAPAKKPGAPAKKPGAPAKKPATAQRSRRHVTRQRGDSNGQSKRKPPKRGTRA